MLAKQDAHLFLSLFQGQYRLRSAYRKHSFRSRTATKSIEDPKDTCPLLELIDLKANGKQLIVSMNSGSAFSYSGAYTPSEF